MKIKIFQQKIREKKGLRMKVNSLKQILLYNLKKPITFADTDQQYRLPFVILFDQNLSLLHSVP